MTCNRSALVFLLAACGIVGLLFGGCGPKRAATFPVKGRVTYMGQPVTQGSIAFYPAEGRMATGDIGPDGRYSLTTFRAGDGAQPGQHRVTIDAKRIMDAPGQPKSLKEEGRMGSLAAGKVEWLVPEKYSHRETSPLTVEVTHGQNTIDFNLPVP
jgi:hypothetical protein